MVSLSDRPTRLTELNWLAEVREFAPPLQPDSPIWMRKVHGSMDIAPICGERHPCCEICLILEGEGTEFIEAQEARFAPGNLLFIGPGVPHSVQIDQYPHRSLTLFFLPALLLELGPLGDGAAMLQRFTMRQNIGQRILRLPSANQSKFAATMRKMWMDFHARSLGWETRLRASLTELIVTVIQWERDQGEPVVKDQLHKDWLRLEHALAYMRRHFAEPIYATDLARVTAMSETRLKNMFEQTLGMPWTRFLQGYRVRRAAAQLCVPGQNVTEVALSAGFQSMSHFIRVFRKYTGTAPSAYARKQHSIRLDHACPPANLLVNNQEKREEELEPWLRQVR